MGLERTGSTRSAASIALRAIDCGESLSTVLSNPLYHREVYHARHHVLRNRVAFGNARGQLSAPQQEGCRGTIKEDV